MSSQAIKSDRKKAQYYFNRGTTYFQIKQYEKAISDLTNAIDLYRNSKDFQIKIYQKMLTLRSKVYMNNKEYSLALDDANKLVKYDPTNINYLIQRGSLYSFLDSLTKSLIDFNKAIELNPTNKSYYFNRAIVNYKLQNYENTLYDCNIYIEDNLSKSVYYGIFLKSAAFIELEKYDKANYEIKHARNYTFHSIEDSTSYFILQSVINKKLEKNNLANKYFKHVELLMEKENKIDRLEKDLIVGHSKNIKAILKEWGKI